MKKVLAFLLALSMCLVFVTGCTKIANDDPAARGAIFDVYLGKKVMNLDPAIAYTDDNAVKILSLIFEGLFKLDEKGNLKKALAKKWEITEDPKTGEERLEITIKDTYWSCGSAVQANDVVYAWRRILDPNFDSPAASMLYCIKGAKQVKNGEISPYDLGLYAEKSNKIIVEFEEGTDIKDFLYTLTSPALVPLRENKVSQYPDWSRSATDLSTNGPFRVKKFSDDPTEHITLERSRFYYLNQEVETEAKDKYVTPYQINIRYDVPADSVKAMYDNKELFYISGMTAVMAADYGKNVQIEDEASAFMFYFNFNSELFETEAVRKAFSLALDRNAIANQIGLDAKPATGILNDKVFNTKKGTSFREEGGAIIDSNKKIDEAKALLAEAGIEPLDYDFVRVLIRWDEKNDGQGSYNSNERIIADAAIAAWRELGFEVEPIYATNEQFETAYATGEYDVIGADYQMISTNALYDLAMFSSEYNKTGSLLSWYQSTYVSGEKVFVKKTYTDEAFEKLIADAFAESDVAKRAEILHNAEKELIEKGLVIPVVFNTNAYVVSPELKKVKTNYWGVQNFQKANLKNYVQYLPSVRGTTPASISEEE